MQADILILSMKFYPASGGSATYAYNLALGLAQKGMRVVVLAPSYGKRKSDDSQYPFPVRRMKMTNEKFSFIRHGVAWLYLILLCWKYRPRYIWATTYAGGVVLGIKKFRRVKILITIHGGAIHRRFPPQRFGDRIGNILGLRTICRADARITVSEEARQMIHRRLHSYLSGKDFQVIYNGLSFEPEILRTKEEALSRFPEYRNKKILLTVGRLVRAKGHDTVIRAVRLLLPEYPDLVYLICGEGPEKDSLIHLTQSLQLEPVVHFKGYVSAQDLEWYYGLTDVFVMTGRETEHFVEGFGLVYIEASLRGKPVIGARVGGVPEAIRENETGLLVEPDQPEQTAEAIRRLLRDPLYGRQMGEYGKRFAMENFTVERMADHNMKLLKHLSV